MKPVLSIITTLLVSLPLVAAADSADEGPFELTEAGMDAVTAGSISVPPSAAVSVLADATGGTATATSTGPTSGRSTDIATTPEVAAAAAINPYAATINWTRKILGTEISAFSQVAPGGVLLDFWHYRRLTIR